MPHPPLYTWHLPHVTFAPRPSPISNVCTPENCNNGDGTDNTLSHCNHGDHVGCDICIVSEKNDSTLPPFCHFHGQESNVLVEHYNLVCEGKKSIIWIGVMFFYIIATQLVAVYLAFRTRKVKIKALNDAKYLAFIIYSSTVTITVMIIGAISLRDFLHADAAVFSTGVLLFTSLILGLLFVPKVNYQYV